MNTYSGDLQRDRFTLMNGNTKQKKQDHVYNTAIYDHIGLVDFLKEMAGDKVTSKNIKRVSPRMMHTEIGGRALYLAGNNVQYDTEANCCEESEPRLIKALQPEIIQNPATKSPIIFTYHGALAGILKRFGERTTYGLADHPNKGLYAKTFHGLTKNSEFIESLPPSNHAWEVALDTPILETFDPLRISAFAAPLEVRQQHEPMSFNDQPGLSNKEWNTVQSYTHEMIYDLAEEARKNAITVSPV